MIMLYPIPGSCGIYVSLNCEFFYQDGSVCELPIYDNKVEIKMYGEMRQVDKTWLKHLAVFAIDDPECFNYVEFYDLLGKARGYQTQVVYKYPKWYSKTHRIVPGFTTVAIDAVGNCIDARTGEPIKDNVKTTGYHYVNIYDPRYRRQRALEVQRLVALAWVYNQDPITCHVVNHRDGNKNNNRKSNLEWTTHLGNILHAVKIGLRNDNCRCKLRNIYTNEIVELPSISETLKFLGMKYKSKETIMFQNVRANKLYANKYELRVGDDNRPWVYDETSMNKEASRYIITVVDKDIVKQFNGVRSFIQFYKLWNLPTMSAKEAIRALKEKEPKLEVSIIDQYTTLPIEVMEIATGIVMEFPTIRSVVNTLNMNKNQALSSARSNGKKSLHGYRIRYKTTESWTEEIAEVKSVPCRIEVVQKVTQETHIFASLREASRILAIDRRAIM